MVISISIIAPLTHIANVSDIRDIKPPVYFKTNLLFFFILGGILFLAGILALTFFFMRRFRDARMRVAEPPKPAHIKAYEALEALKAKNLPDRGMIKAHYSELSDIARRYIEDRFTIRAPEMTTEEFLSSVKISGILTGMHKNQLKEFLGLCDIVKFAKYSPNTEEIHQSFDAAVRFIDDTKEAEPKEPA